MKLKWMAAAAAAGLGYSLAEARRYRLKSYDIPVLPEGFEPISILQISDLHLRASNRKLASFVESLGDRSYDLVLATGDLLGEPAAVEACTKALNCLNATGGRCFVLGSSDYYAPAFKGYLDYFLKIRRPGTRPNRTADLVNGLNDGGWHDLTNRTLHLKAGTALTQLTGLDDPYLHRDDRSKLIRDLKADLAVCVVHDPDPYDVAVSAGFDLVVAGHTHGGQVRFPFVGALVTNSTLPTALARGISKVGPGWLFVTPGLGTGKFAPFRFMCPPEASVLNLIPRT